MRPAAATRSPDRPDEPVGHLQRGKDRQPDNDQGAEQQRGVEPQLVGPRPRQQHLIIVHHFVGALDLLLELRLEHPGGIEIGARAVVELGQRPDAVRRVDLHGRLGAQLVDLGPGNDPFERPVVGIHQRQRTRHAVRPDVDDDRLGQVAVEHLAAEPLAEARVVDRDQVQVAGEIAAHGDGFVGYPLDLAVVRRPRDLNGILEHSAGAVGKPEFEAALEQQRGEDRHQHGRNRGKDREQRDQPRVQPPAAKAARLGAAHRDPAGIKDHQDDRRDQVGDQQQRDQRRREHRPGSRAGAKQPGTERHRRYQEDPGDDRQAAVEAPARPLALKPAVLLRYHRRFARPSIHCPGP